jgi:hypothetical protein
VSSLFSTLQDFIQRSPLDELNDEIFNNLALKVFYHQRAHNKNYRQYCESIGFKELTHWTEIPILTTELFKFVPLTCFNSDQATKIFHSSGSTSSDKSIHYLSSQELELYELSLWRTFSNAFNLNTEYKPSLFILTEKPSERENSSLIHMFKVVAEKLGYSENCFYYHNELLDWERLQMDFQHSVNKNTPCLIAGTAFSFVHLLDSPFRKIQLPSGSMLMETGGYKGKSRELSKEELYDQISSLFHIDKSSIVGQYGMSELCTQYYDSPISRLKRATPWSRVRVLSTNDLSREVEVGEIGLLAHYDLANIDSCAFVLSGDLGIKKNFYEFDIIGRASQLKAKGCSLNYSN